MDIIDGEALHIHIQRIRYVVYMQEKERWGEKEGGRVYDSLGRGREVYGSNGSLKCVLLCWNLLFFTVLLYNIYIMCINRYLQ